MTNEPPTPPQPPPGSEAEAVPTEAPTGIPGGGEPGATPGAPPPRRRLTRSRTNRVVAGVAGGLGEYFEVDPTLVRIAIVVITVITGGAFALVYIAAILVMPRGEGESSPLAAHGGASTAGTSAAVGIVVGLILIAIGLTALVQNTGLPDIRWDAMLSVVLALIGLALLFEARHGVNGGLVAVGIVLTAVLAVATSVPSAHWDSGFGDRTEHPTTLTALDRSYDHAFGSMIVDLRDVPFPEGETRIDIGVAFGDVSVRVPTDVGVRVTGSTIFGSSSVLGRQHDGIDDEINEATPGYDSAPRRLRIDLSNAFGSVTVRQ